MQALRVSRRGGFEAPELGDLLEPSIREDEVLLRMHPARMNHLDMWVRRGVEGNTCPPPLVLGSDGAGVIARGGGHVTSVRPGARVAVSPGSADPTAKESLLGRHNLHPCYGISGETRDGTCAELMAVPAATGLAMPVDLSFDEAAIDSTREDWPRRVRELTDRRGVDVVIDHVGEATIESSLQVLGRDGAVVIRNTLDPRSRGTTVWSPSRASRSRAPRWATGARCATSGTFSAGLRPAAPPPRDQPHAAPLVCGGGPRGPRIPRGLRQDRPPPRPLSRRPAFGWMPCSCDRAHTLRARIEALRAAVPCGGGSGGPGR